VVGPILTIALVVLAFTFVPSLSGKSASASSGSLKGRIRSTVKDLGQSIRSEAGQLKNIDLKSLATPAPSPAGSGDASGGEGPGALQQIQDKIQGAAGMIRGQAGQVQEAAQPQ
jgi:hypothetical protein